MKLSAEALKRSYLWEIFFNTKYSAQKLAMTYHKLSFIIIIKARIKVIVEVNFLILADHISTPAIFSTKNL